MPDDDWSIQSKCRQVIFRTQVGNRYLSPCLYSSQLRSHWNYQKLSTVVASNYSTPFSFVCIQSVCQLVYAHVMTIVLFMLYCRCWPDYHWEWATAYWKVRPIALGIYVHTGSWYPGHITDNGIPLVCKIMPIHVHRTYCIYSDCVVQSMICSKIFSFKNTFDSQLHKLYCWHGIVWLTSTVFLSSRGELSREVDELMIKLRDTEKYVWNSCLSK